MTNTLYYGDNLDVLRRYIDDASVDLVYLDPPFKSDQNYNVLFAAKDGTEAAAQIQAFEDTWHWDERAARQFDESVRAGGRVADVLLAFRQFLGPNDMLAYLAMMAPRLVELHRVLKPTGSLYLHCDPTASHYLKLLLDAVFGPERFQSEIVWKRTGAHSDAKQGRKGFGHVHDTLLFYMNGAATWNPQHVPYDSEYIESHYGLVEEGTGRRYQLDNITGPGGAAKGNPAYEVMGVVRHWRFSRDRMNALIAEGRIVQPSAGAVPRYKRYLDEMPGVLLSDVWTDIAPLNSQAQERLGYPTQKPEALLERILSVSTNEGDVVLDPFCGCGTTIAAAQKLGRSWIGIDVTHLAIGLIKSRLQASFASAASYQVIGEPTTVDGAKELAQEDPYQFQYWALGLVGARGTDQKKGPDKGIDGVLIFRDGRRDKYERIILSVKAGKLHASYVRDLRGVIERERAAIGVLISFEQPTKKMREEAAAAGFFETPWGSHPRLQLRTVGELLEGKGIDYPRTEGINQTFRQAPRTKGRRKATPGLFDAEAD